MEQKLDDTLIAKLFRTPVERRGAQQIAARFKWAIRTGRLLPGMRLPTVRSVAELLGVSAGTVASAWTSLRADGLVETRQRGGTVVSGTRLGGDPPNAWPWQSVDLASGIADPALQVDLGEALAEGARSSALHMPQVEQITPMLREAVQQDWPFEAEAFATAAGGSEGILLAIEAATGYGATVAIEQPTSPRLIEMGKLLGLTMIPVACDETGPLPEALAMALRHRPVAFIYQPHVHIPLGHSVSRARLAELAEVITASKQDLWVVEDDNIGPIGMSAPVSMGALLPHRVVHMRAYCRTYGLDLRTSVLGGARQLVDRAVALRSRGLVMNSRILQNAMAFLICDPQTQRALDEARRIYAARRLALAGELARHGFAAANPDGLIVWFEVPDEPAAMINLAQFGIAAGPGSKCFIEPPKRSYLRIATSRLSNDQGVVRQLAATVAQAVRMPAAGSFD